MHLRTYRWGEKVKGWVYLLSFILLFLFENVCEVDELLHGFHLSAQVLQVHATCPTVRLQQQTKPLTHGFIVHLWPATQQDRLQFNFIWSFKNIRILTSLYVKAWQKWEQKEETAYFKCQKKKCPIFWLVRAFFSRNRTSGLSRYCSYFKTLKKWKVKHWQINK